MYRHFLLAVIATLAVHAAVTDAGPSRPILPRLGEVVGPYGSATYVVEFKAHERANCVVIGNGKSALGLYVFDEHGNCVQKDDEGSALNKDDCAVVWYPPRTQKYVIEVKNLGGVNNRYKISLR